MSLSVRFSSIWYVRREKTDCCLLSLPPHCCSQFGKTVAARIVRGLVPYFIGAVVNREMRAELRAPVLLLPEPSPGKLNLACSVLKADR